MLQNRSQTKIRKMQELNLLAEQRYLGSKKILKEGMEEDLQKCFTDANLSLDEIPTACLPKETSEEPTDVVGCVTGLGSVVLSLDADTRNSLTNCVCRLLTQYSGTQMNNQTVKTFCGTVGKTINTGIDILKGGIEGIFGGNAKS